MRTVIKLDPAATRAAVETAVQHRAPVILESDVFEGATINGYLVAADPQALLMEVTGRPPIDPTGLLHVRCDGQVYGERRFSFNTQITATPAWGQTTSIAFARPTEFVVMERRRFLRAKLAPSSKVELSWEKDGSPHRHQAVLLNISTDGLACRIDDATAANIAQHALIEVSFMLPDVEISSLSAIVANKVPGSEGCCLLGLQFVRGEQDARKLSALRTALSSGPSAERELIGQ